MAHGREEFRFGPAGLLGGLHRDGQFPIACFKLFGSLGNERLEIVSIGIEFLLPLLNVLQHRIETVDEQADFVVALLFHSQRVILFLGNLPHAAGQSPNGF